MKVLIVLTARQIGGAELYIEHLLRNLKKTKSCQFTVAISDHLNMQPLAKQLSEYADIQLFSFDNTTHFTKNALALRRLALQHTIVHLNSNHPASRLGIAMGFVLGNLPIPCISVEQRATPLEDIVLPYSLKFVLPTLFRWSRRSIKKVVAVSKENKLTLEHYYGISANKIEVIYNGSDSLSTLDTDYFTRNIDTPIITVLARLVPNKGHRFLIEAAPAILTQFPKLRFVFAGETDQRLAIEKQINLLGLQEKFSILGFLKDPSNLLKQSSIFVLPSLAEGFSLAIVEALASGCIVIATNVGGASEIIEHNVNGFLVPPSNSAALASTIIQSLSQSQEQQIAMRFAARQTSQQFSSANMAEKTWELYLSCV